MEPARPDPLAAFFDDLVRKATARPPDRAAFEHLLVKSYDPLLRQIARGIPLDYDRYLSTEDVLQETFRAAMEALPSFKGHTYAEFAAWARAIARHQLSDARDKIRAQKRGQGKAPLPLSDSDSDPMASELLHHLAGNTRSPQSMAGDKEDIAMMQAAIAELDTTHREVIKLRFVEQVPHAEIGKKIGRSEEAAKMLCLRAVRKLQGMLPDHAGRCPPAHRPSALAAQQPNCRKAQKH